MKKLNQKIKMNVGTNARPLSWSCISSFEYDREGWYKKYILNEVQEPNKEMLFGNVVGGKLASDPSFLPDVPRYKHFEKKLEGRIGNIVILGYLDAFDPDTKKKFHEYKTSSNTKKWTKKSVQEHGQLLFYKLLIWLNYEIPPEEITCHLHYIPVEENGSFEMQLSKESHQSFEAKHTTLDVLNFGRYIVKTYQDMVKYVEAHK